VSLKDFADVTRDVRVDIRDEDIQMGHIESRSEEQSSIRGGNLVFMSRRGNLIIGERNFLENVWKDELRAICADDSTSNEPVNNDDTHKPVESPSGIVFTEVQNTILQLSQSEQSALMNWLTTMHKNEGSN
jgi:hypothetical protein